MYSISSFRGLSGEVVCGFARPGTFLTAIPVLIVWLLVGAAVALTPLSRMFPLNFFLIIVTAALLVARFAIPASRGELSAPFFSAGIHKGETLGFVVRYAVLTVAWGVPASLLAWGMSEPLTGALAQGPGPGLLMQGGAAGFMLLLVSVVFMVAPSLCFIVATATSEVSEVMSLEPWRWLLSARGGDLVAFYGALFGGVAAFTLVYLVPVCLLVSLLFAINGGLGAAAATFIVLMPMAMSPILMGRLCGAFVAGEGTFEPDADRNEMGLLGGGDAAVAGATAAALTARHAAGSQAPAATAGPIAPAAATGPGATAAGTSLGAAPVPGAAAGPVPVPVGGPAVRSGPVGEGMVVKPTLEKIAAKVERLEEEHLPAAVEKAEQFSRAHAGDPHASAELALLYRRVGRPSEARALAGTAITRLVETGAGPMASKVFRVFGAERYKIRLEPKCLEQFGQMLLKMRHFKDAGWCLYGATRGTGGDPVEAQRKMLEVARAATTAGQGEDAVALYRILLRHHPDSELAGEVRSALDAETGKLRAAS